MAIKWEKVGKDIVNLLKGNSRKRNGGNNVKGTVGLGTRWNLPASESIPYTGRKRPDKK